MTWWLSASQDELNAARTCRECGCDDADIDLGLCFDCFSSKSQGDQWRRNAAIARKYGQNERAAEFDMKAADADAGRDQPA